MIPFCHIHHLTRGPVVGIAVDEDVVGADCPWMIMVGFKDWEHGKKVYTDAGDAIEEGMDCLGVDYLSKEETLIIKLEDERQRDDWLVWLLHYLASHRMIDRDQELRAYIEFDLPL